MGRWTPLVLMAGGLAILLGTLIGTWYPMGGSQTAQSPQQAPNRASSVLPANLNVNTTTSGSNNKGAVAQNNAPTDNNDNSTTNNTNIDQNQSTSGSTSADSNSNSGNSPIRALW